MVLKDRIALAKIMAIHHISQRQLAAAAGWRSHGHVTSLLSGKKRTVTPKSAFLIAQRLGLPIDALFVPRVSADSGRSDRAKPAA